MGEKNDKKIESGIQCEHFIKQIEDSVIGEQDMPAMGFQYKLNISGIGGIVQVVEIIFNEIVRQN